MHHGVYGSPTTANPTPDTKSIRATLVPWLEQNGFKIVIQGHQYNYQRSFPLTYGVGGNTPTVMMTATGNTSSEYYSLNGIVYFVVGSGGQTLQAFTSQASYIAAQNATDFGILQLQITGRKITGGFYDLNGAQKDSFLISKDAKPTTDGGGGGGADPNAAVKDKHGVRKMFATKAGAEAKDAYMRTHDEIISGTGGGNPRTATLNGTTSTHTAAHTYTIVAAGDSTTWLHGSSTYWTIVYPDTNVPSGSAPVGTTDHSLMLKNGFIRDATDWRAVEMTIYGIMLNKDENAPTLNQSTGMIFRSGAHHANGVGCNGVGYLTTILYASHR